MPSLDDDLGFEPAPAPAASIDDDLGFEPAPVAEPAPTPGNPPATPDSSTPAEPSTWDNLKYAASHPVEAIKGVGEAGQTLAESVLSPLGIQTPVAAAEAALPYAVGKVKDLLAGTDTTPTFKTSIEEARKEINKRAGKYEPTAAIGRFAGDTGAGIVTGGFGTAYLGAKAAQLGGALAEAAPVIARTTSTAAKLLGPAVSAAAKAGIQLAAEGAVQGAEQAAATVIDKQIAQGDFQGLAGKLYSEIPAQALEGAKWNTLIGAPIRVGLHYATKGKGPSVEDLKFKNAASETPDVADVYDPNLPLRSSDLVDSGSPQAVAARKLTTPDVAKDVQDDALPDLEKSMQKLFSIEDNHAKSLAHAAENAFDDVNVSNAAEPNLQTQNVHYKELPLRASEMVDNATPDVIAARKAITPEAAEKLSNRSIAALEKNTNHRLEIEAALDHKLRLRQKTDYLKTYDQPWQGPDLNTILTQNGLSKETLKDLAENTVGDGGQVKRILRQVEIEERGLNSARVPIKTTVRGALGEEIAHESSRSVPTQGQMLSALDQIKRTAQKVAAKKGGLLHEALLEPTENLRLFLENPNNVPETAARGQQAVNAQWSPDIDLQRQASGFFTDGRIKADRVGGDPYEVIDTLDVGKLKSIVSSIGKEGADETAEEIFKARARQRINSFGERLRWGGDEPGNRELLKEYAELTHEAETELNRAALVNRYAEQAAVTPPVDPALSALRAGDRVNTSTLSGLLNSLGTGAADGTEEGLKSALRRKEQQLAAGPAKEEYRALRIKVENQINRVALANKYAAETAKNPPRQGVLPGVVGAIAGMGAGAAAGPLGSTVGAGVGGLVAKKSADALHAWNVSKNADAAKAALNIRSAVIKAQTRLTKAARWQNAIEEAANPIRRGANTVNIEEIHRNVLNELKKIDERQDPEHDTTKKTLSKLDDLTQHGGEELGQAYAELMDARDAFLLGKVPTRHDTMFGPEEHQLDDDTAHAFARYQAATDDPMGALERMSRGEATAEDTEVLGTLYQPLVNEFRTKMLDDVTGAKKKLTYPEKVKLASVLGVGLTPDSDIDTVSFLQGLSSGAGEDQAPKLGNKSFKGPNVASKADALG